jgi:hypothetical protein
MMTDEERVVLLTNRKADLHAESRTGLVDRGKLTSLLWLTHAFLEMSEIPGASGGKESREMSLRYHELDDGDDLCDGDAVWLSGNTPVAIELWAQERSRIRAAFRRKAGT